ncbi:hypothetical protein DFH08DRAFT_1008197 [Mycena albidolilacea]|uniref:Uncharacterized protein n=1 Tax=Mycena albidolilacea TaxID=1033008 RepID=A0AAD7ER09_9AGAR|nr:hypothetical protein DFH08DRAFT_1008197 [Mycena albidolilacea]
MFGAGGGGANEKRRGLAYDDSCPCHPSDFQAPAPTSANKQRPSYPHITRGLDVAPRYKWAIWLSKVPFNTIWVYTRWKECGGCQCRKAGLSREVKKRPKIRGWDAYLESKQAAWASAKESRRRTGRQKPKRRRGHRNLELDGARKTSMAKTRQNETGRKRSRRKRIQSGNDAEEIMGTGKNMYAEFESESLVESMASKESGTQKERGSLSERGGDGSERRSGMETRCRSSTEPLLSLAKSAQIEQWEYRAAGRRPPLAQRRVGVESKRTRTRAKDVGAPWIEPKARGVRLQWRPEVEKERCQLNQAQEIDRNLQFRAKKSERSESRELLAQMQSCRGETTRGERCGAKRVKQCWVTDKQERGRAGNEKGSMANRGELSGDGRMRWDLRMSGIGTRSPS